VTSRSIITKSEPYSFWAIVYKTTMRCDWRLFTEGGAR